MGGKEPWNERRLVLQRLLRSMREQAQLTQVDLAVRLNADQSFVSRFERGERRLDLVELTQICESCGVSIEVFARRFASEIR